MTEAPIQRQLVNFSFYKVDPAWRRLPELERVRGKAEFVEIVKSYSKELILLPYSTVGIRSDADFLLWRIGLALEPMQEMSAKLSRTGLGSYLTTTYSYLATTKRSMYIDKHTHEGQEGSRTRIKPGLSKYLFVYPFVKTRAWYQLPFEERQAMMDEHIKVGNKYPSVRLHTTYSFGLDDQEFIVAFETDRPQDFLDLVIELRETKGSSFTLRDTPIFTCVAQPFSDILKHVGG